MSKPKQPQDHQRKGAAVEKLRQEAQEEVAGAFTREVTLKGRRGEVTVAVLEDPMEWGIDATELIEEWQTRDRTRGGITASEMRRFLSAIVSVEDADRIRAIEPTQASLSEAAAVLIAPAAESDEASLGESQAS